jgi:hypothetical protein
MLAGLYRMGAEHLLLTARIMTGTFGLLTLSLVTGLIVAAGRRSFAAWMLGLVAAVVLLFNPLFAYTSGLAWNHDQSVFVLLCSVAALWRGFVTRKALMIGAAGLFLGLAVGVRATIVPIALPMTAALLWQIYMKKTLTTRSLVAFVVAGILTQTPTLILAIQAPERFWWGNLGYAMLNTRLREDTAFERAMSMPDKLTYLRDVVFPWNDHRRGNLLLLVWALVGGIAGVFALRSGPSLDAHDPASSATEDRMRAPVWMLLALAPFALAGSLLPTPSWVQYYYVCVPLLIVASGCAIASAMSVKRASCLVCALIVASLAIAAVESARKLTPDERGLRWPSAVVPIEVHKQGQQLAKLTKGRVLTIDPIYALEGGRSIFSELTSGAYAYRVARFMPADDRKRLLIVGPEEIGTRLASERNPPALFIREPRVIGERLSHEDDEAIRTYGITHGWTATPIDARHTLFTPP